MTVEGGRATNPKMGNGTKKKKKGQGRFAKGKFFVSDLDCLPWQYPWSNME
jgi:hypothetical protein